jgi:hypothetical protein
MQVIDLIGLFFCKIRGVVALVAGLRVLKCLDAVGVSCTINLPKACESHQQIPAGFEKQGKP